MMQRSPKRPPVKRFDRAPQSNIPRSSFDLSHPYKTTFDSGLLIPFLIQEVVPADSFSVRTTAFIRLATPLHPTMDNLHVESFYFFIANRLTWDSWQAFMGEQENPGDSTDFLVPSMDSTGQYDVGTLGDYFGLPTTTIGLDNISALPFRAYALTFHEWFRDENLQEGTKPDKGPGPDTITDFPLYRRGKRKDYLSSSLPWPQKGPGVDISIGDRAPLAFEPSASFVRGGDIDNTANTIGLEVSAAPGNVETSTSTVGGTVNAWADLSQAEGATINDLRQAFQIQKLQERDARGGTRYTEIIRSHFLTVSPDQRLQRPEYLGGGFSSIQMNTVPQTSSTSDSQGPVDTPQGNLTAYGTGAMINHGFSKSFVEHGYILGLFSVRADINYQQRVDRHWKRSTKYDFYWPALQALGEQPVYNYEAWADGTEADDEVWGYQERWSEMRQQLGVITGKFRSSDPESLDPWHYALDFETRPTLDSVFVEDNPPIKRTIAVQDEPEFLIDAWHNIRAARPMPIYSVPGYIDHF